MCHFLAQGSHRGNFSCDESTKGSWCLQRKAIREYLKMHFVQGTHYLGPGIPVWVHVLLWHIYVLIGSDPGAFPGCAAPSRKTGQFHPVEVFHLWNVIDSLSWIHFHSVPPGIPWQERLRPAGGANGTSPFWKDLENWGPEIKRWKRSLNFINILLLLPESEKWKDSLVSKYQVVQLGSYSPSNSRTTSSSCIDLDAPYHLVHKHGQGDASKRWLRMPNTLLKFCQLSAYRNCYGFIEKTPELCFRHLESKTVWPSCPRSKITKQNWNDFINSLLWYH